MLRSPVNNTRFFFSLATQKHRVADKAVQLLKPKEAAGATAGGHGGGGH